MIHRVAARRVFKARPGLLAVVISAVAMPHVVQTQAPTKRPASTVQQLMQAILFPNANLIFSAQTEDPAAAPRDARPSTSMNPLTGLYGGWQAVENSSLALMESADLLDLKGRVCANGTPAPVDEPQWKTEVEVLRKAAGAALAAARARNLDQVIETAGQLTDSCSSCHRIYRRAQNHCVSGVDKK